MSSNLRQWMLCYDNSNNHDDGDKYSTVTTPIKQSHDILILDGGVSTFLEQLLKEDTCHDPINTTYSENSIETTDGTNRSSDCCGFQHRSLWSSSLLLNLKGQAYIQSAHDAFYNAGSDIISTVTYQLSHHICRDKQQSHHHNYDQVGKGTTNDELNLSKKDVDDLLRLGVQLAYEVKLNKMKLREMKQNQMESSSLYIVVSLGCFGACLADGSEYRGNYGKSLQELMMFHERRYNTIMDLHSDTTSTTNVDGIAFETVPCALEVKAIINVLKERKVKMKNIKNCDNDVAVWLSLACKDEASLNDGSSLSRVLDSIELLDDQGLIHGIGVNCFNIKYTQCLTETIAKHQVMSETNRAILFYPNSGEEWDASNETWLEGSGCSDADEFAQRMMYSVKSVQAIFKQENRSSRIIIGGCCRTSPSTIQALRASVENYENE